MLVREPAGAGHVFHCACVYLCLCAFNRFHQLKVASGPVWTSADQCGPVSSSSDGDGARRRMLTTGNHVPTADGLLSCAHYSTGPGPGPGLGHR